MASALCDRLNESMLHYTLINVVAIGLVLVAPLVQADVFMKQVRRTDPFTVMGHVRPAKTETTTNWPRPALKRDRPSRPCRAWRRP